MNTDAKRIRFIVSYAGSDAGNAARDAYIAEVAALRTEVAALREALRKTSDAR